MNDIEYLRKLWRDLREKSLSRGRRRRCCTRT